jgi:hypothetical protein
MEKLCFFPMAHFPLFLLQLLSLLLVSSAQVMPIKYFLNCGSKSDIIIDDRKFVGDMNQGTFRVGQSYPISFKSSTDIPLYQTARFFEQPASYEFEILDYGLYYVRLHFYPYMHGKTNLMPNVRFDVSIANFSLLSNFGIEENSKLPVIEEFLLTLKGGVFNLQFAPRGKSKAFVNAIEVFLIPDKDFVMDDFPVITPTGKKAPYVGVRSQVLRTIHRVNVGGPETNDTLWRPWIPDDAFLLSPASAKTCPPYDGEVRYDVLGANIYSATDVVYNTCKELGSNSSLVTWRFDVSKNARHLLRLHFCDIISLRSAVVKFDASIYSNFKQMIYPDDPFNKVEQLSAPFYWDFLVDSDESGVLSVSIGPRQDSPNKNAYLNGLEILEFSKELN